MPIFIGIESNGNGDPKMLNITLKDKLIIKGRIKLETALHIGGSKTGIEIGGVDNPVLKDHEGKPYIPGSSLKGKMRSLLEKSGDYLNAKSTFWQVEPDVKEGKISKEGIRMHLCDGLDCPICNIFGRNNGEYQPYYEPETKEPKPQKVYIKTTTPTRLIVRDAKLIYDEDEKSKKFWDEVKGNLELEWTEVKFENSIDRITSAANPRQTERVPRGAEFDLEMVYTIYEDADKERFKKLLEAMQLLEDDYLGGCGSRGYGKVSFNSLKIYRNSKEDYKDGKTDTSQKEPVLTGKLRDIAQDKKLIEKLFGQNGKEGTK